MLSLAPILYRNVFVHDGGPIERITVRRFPILGQESFLANARLDRKLATVKPKYAVYGNEDGSGSSKNLSIARHKAISEALERWAYFATARSGDAEKYGFTIDRSSNGMAAFPGFVSQARRKARMEALERFAVTSWWAGCLKAEAIPSQWPDIRAFRIDHGRRDGHVVILYRKSAAGVVAYGHAANSSVNSAIASAVTELVRAEHAISLFRARGDVAQISDPVEARCIYYSKPEGHAEFLEHLQREPIKPRPPWREIFNGEIRGPWTRWASVWRCCVEMPDYRFLDPRQMVFS